MVARVIAAIPSAAALDSSCAPPALNRLRKPSIPTVMLIITTTNPAISGGKYARSGRRRRETPISTRPAKIVIPNTRGRPPAFSAMHRRRQIWRGKDRRSTGIPTRRHRAPSCWRIGPTAITTIESARTSSVSSADSPTSRHASTGTSRKIDTSPTCCRPLTHCHPSWRYIVEPVDDIERTLHGWKSSGGSHLRSRHFDRSKQHLPRRLRAASPMSRVKCSRGQRGCNVAHRLARRRYRPRRSRAIAHAARQQALP